MSEDTPDRFWSKVKRAEGCWLWLAYVDEQGYGHIWWRDHVRSAHRVAYELAVGPIPPGRHLDHRCHSPAECTPGPTCPHRRCVRPTHLEAVTPLVNAQRARGAVVRCVKGHAYTPENTYVHPSRGRQCRECVRISGRSYRRRQKEMSR